MEHSKHFMELNLFHDMFSEEHDKAVSNLKRYCKLTKQYLDFVKQKNDDHATFIKTHAMAISNFSSITNVIRLFNIEMETVKMLDIGLPEFETEQKLELDKCLEINLQKSLSLAESEPLLPTKMVESDVDKEFVLDFTFPENDLKKYFLNYESKASISYVKNAAKKLFYIIDLNSEYFSSGVLNMEKYFTESPIILDHFPKQGVVFGLLTENYMFRVVRENPEPSGKNVRLLMIDIGEEVIFDPKIHTLCWLSEMHQNIPSQALCCKLEKVKGSSVTNLETFLKTNKYTKQRFKILNIVNKILHVELSSLDSPPSTNPFNNGCNASNSTTSSDEARILPLSNPFRQFRCKPTNELANKSWSDSKFIDVNDYKLSTSFLQNEDTQFEDIKIINENQCNVKNVNWSAIPDRPGININAPQYIPKSQMYKFPEPQNSYIHESNNQIVPYNNNNSISANNYQQPLIYNYNNFSTNQIPNLLNYNKFENINCTPILSNNKKMLNTESNELIRPETSNYQQMLPSKHNDNTLNKYSFKFIDKNNDYSNDVISLAPSTHQQMLPFKYNDDSFDRYALKSIDQNFDIHNNLSINENVPTKHFELTAEQLRELNEEPLNTENAMVAVMGYNPKDDKRICKFYNSQTGECFKGANCTYEHVQKLKDGWTRDRKITKILPTSEIVNPQVGESYDIIVTHIVSVEEFYAHIPSLYPKSLQSLQEVAVKMNSFPMKSSYVPFNIPPVEHELVFSLYSDGQWYRAQIVNVYDNEQFQVYYIDYGNCRTVSLSDLRKWNECFDFLPAQAFHCRLENVKRKSLMDLSAITFFKEITSKPVTAIILNNTDKLYVTLLDSDGFDIGEQICVSNHGHPRSAEETLPAKQIKYIPV